MWIEHVAPDTRGQRAHLETKLWGRVLAEDVTLSRRHRRSRRAPC